MGSKIKIQKGSNIKIQNSSTDEIQNFGFYWFLALKFGY